MKVRKTKDGFDIETVYFDASTFAEVYAYLGATFKHTMATDSPLIIIEFNSDATFEEIKDYFENLAWLEPVEVISE